VQGVSAALKRRHFSQRPELSAPAPCFIDSVETEIDGRLASSFSSSTFQLAPLTARWTNDHCVLDSRKAQDQQKFTLSGDKGAPNCAVHVWPGCTGHASVQVPVVTTSPACRSLAPGHWRNSSTK
jgi:hypothetical protein